MTTDLTPTRLDVENDTYALVIHEGGQVLYQYEKPTPWEDPQWIEKRQYDHGEVPPLNLEQTQVEQKTNGENLQTVTLYASKLDADTTNTTSGNHSKAGEESYQGYAIRFSDGHVIPDEEHTVHTTQEQNMGAAVDYLVREHDLINSIDIPHFPPRARQNCSINSEPVHPNGDEMRSPYELTGGYHLYTSLNRQSKQTRIEDLAGVVDLSVEFLGDW
ncbi:hypothetical protein [Halogranum rubrum]|uniref:Uncharacterized protein n=1 Tax=Halogranum salarium B-1 TaxID=1210908 RepID=J3JG19_9EURY|nr:hypothetical protein [Halogranum salarium]EJN59706.1 hypothetical protein HSB1_18640 [Halogranum salarium B-1]